MAKVIQLFQQHYDHTLEEWTEGPLKANEYEELMSLLESGAVCHTTSCPALTTSLIHSLIRSLDSQLSFIFVREYEPFLAEWG